MAEGIVAVEYREVPGYPRYRVGSDGSVWSLKRSGWKLLNQFDSNGYRRVELHRDGVPSKHFVHRLVLEAFVGPCPDGMDACHFPIRDRDCNRLDNLRWDTKKNNHADMLIHGTRLQGEQLPWHKLTVQDVETIREEYAVGVSTRELAERYGISQANIGGIIKGEHWKCAGGPIVNRPLKSPKLTDDDVRSIKRRHATEGTRKLAEEFGVAQNTIVYIMLGKRRGKVVP